MNHLRIRAISADPRHLQQIVQMLHAAGESSVSEGTPDQLDNFADALPPDVMIVDSAGEGHKELETLERLGQRFPDLSFILLCAQQSPEFLIQAMRSGVREVLPSPADADALRTALDRIRYKRGFAPSKKGKMLAFISCKGGSGATLLAANLAYALAEGGSKVALFDLNLQFGDALLFLSDQKPASTLSDVARDIERLDAAFLASSLVAITPNFGVLAAPEDPAQSMEVTPAHIDALLALARNHYDFIVLDVGRTIDARTIKALDHADVIFPVLQTTMPYVRDGKRLLDVFRSLDYPKDKVQLIVNRYQKGGDISLDDLERSLDHKVARVVPNHYEATAASVNQGVPIARLARKSPVTRALQEWRASLSRVPEQAGTGWIARVFKRA